MTKIFFVCATNLEIILSSTCADGYAEKIRSMKFKNLLVIRVSGYQGVPAGGRDIRESGLEILWFPLSLMHWSSGTLHPDFLVS